jgi:hypothetical protein
VCASRVPAASAWCGSCGPSTSFSHRRKDPMSLPETTLTRAVEAAPSVWRPRAAALREHPAPETMVAQDIMNPRYWKNPGGRTAPSMLDVRVAFPLVWGR